MKQNKEIIIYDTEFWTDDGVLERHWGGVFDKPPLLYQIGAFKVSLQEGLPVIDEFHSLIYPKDENGDHVKTTQYFEDLTNITQDMVEKEGVPLQDSLLAFKKFCGQNYMFSYGRDMLNAILPSCFIESVKCPFHAKQSKDIRPVFIKSGMSIEELSKNSSGTLAEYFGIKIDNHFHHDARSDAFSILVALRHLLEQKRLELSFLAE